MNVKPLYAEYLSKKAEKLLERQEHLPRFCNIPFDWRVHCVHRTMQGDTSEQSEPIKGNNTYTWRNDLLE
eukprot:184145-Prymnesium_polylepis.1